MKLYKKNKGVKNKLKRKRHLALFDLRQQRKRIERMEKRNGERLKECKNRLESNMLEIFGSKQYKQTTGFLPSRIYELVGRDDGVATLFFRKDSSMDALYPEGVTVSFVYTLSERKQLEENICSLDDNDTVAAKLLLIGDNYNVNKDIVEICVHDVKDVLLTTTTDEQNKFHSKELRSLHTLPIPLRKMSKGQDIGWMYGYLKRMKDEGVALMPQEESQFLAYKLNCDKESLTDEEKKLIFNDKGKVANKEVSYYYLKSKKEASTLSEEDERLLKRLSENRFTERLVILDEELRKAGMNRKKLCVDYPSKAKFLLEQLVKFCGKRFNGTGKHLLYINFETFTHIYLRHVEEMKMKNQFEERDKFQLKEDDVLQVLGLVMRAVNDEYQIWKEKHPNGRSYRAGKMAYYFNGDYYCFDVEPDGRISTFYKGSGNKSKNSK